MSDNTGKYKRGGKTPLLRSDAIFFKADEIAASKHLKRKKDIERYRTSLLGEWIAFEKEKEKSKPSQEKIGFCSFC